MIFPDYTRPESTILDIIADLLLLGAGIVLITFVVLYAAFMNWRKTRAGQAVLMFTSSLAALVMLVLASKLTGGDYWGRDGLRVVVYGWVTVSTTWLLVTLIRSWLRGGPALDVRPRESIRPPRTREDNPSL